MAAPVAQKPFRRRADPLADVRPDLPVALRLFHRLNAVYGLESAPERHIRLATPAEVRRVRWPDLLAAHGDPPPVPNWATFAGWLIGTDSTFDEIVLTTDGPWGRPGSVLAIGSNVFGPIGPPDPAEQLETGVVLASSFAAWLAHLETTGWMEYGLFPGELASLTPAARERERAYYHRLNPHAEWAKP